MSNHQRAIQIAGGMTLEANVRQIWISRLRVNDANQATNFDLWKFLRFGSLTQNLLLQDGDTITVPTVRNTAFVQAPQEVSDQVATNITILGNVVHPGNFVLSAKATLNQAILAAGGLKSSRANRKNIVVLIHLNPNGSTTQKIVDISTPQQSNKARVIPIDNNDVIVIPQTYSANVNTPTNNILQLFSNLNFTLGGSSD